MATKRLAVFDIDGTLFRWQLFYEIELELRRSGLLDEKAAKKIDAAYHAWESRLGSFKNFERAALEVWYEFLPRLTSEQFQTAVKNVLDQMSHKVYSYTRNLVIDLKKQGYFLLAISGSQQEIAQPFAEKYGFDDCIGWLYEQTDGYFTGTTLRDTVSNKAKLLQDYAAEYSFNLEQSIAVGDSNGDIGMLELVGRPIAFNPSEELLDAAVESGWEIVIERKNIAYVMKKGTDGSFVLAQTDRF